MRDLYSDDYDSVAQDGTARLIPEGMRKAAGATMFLGLVAALAVWAWHLGTRDAAEVPIIRAMEGPARIQPEDPGGLQASHQGLEVNSVLAGKPEPAPRAIAEPTTPALAIEDGPQDDLVAIETPEAEAVASDGLEDASPEAASSGPAVSTTDLAALVAEAVGPPETVGGDAEADPALERVSLNATRPRVRPSDLRAAPSEAAASVATSPEATRTAAPREVAAGGLGAGTRLVQLGAYDSEELTRQAWASLVERHGALLGDKSLYVERTTSNARVFYRLRVAGFDSTDQTRDLCEALRAQGVDCIPVTLQ